MVPWVILSPENQRTDEEGNGPSGMSHCGAMRADPARMPAQGTLGDSRNQSSTGASLLHLLPSEDPDPEKAPLTSALHSEVEAFGETDVPVV